MIKRLFLLFLVLTISVGFAGVPTLNTGIDRGAARTDASNVTATQSWRDTIDVYSKAELASVSLPLTGGTLTGSLLMADGALMEAATGTITDLSFRLRTDTNTGFYSSAADALDIVTGGTLRMRFGNTGVTTTVHIGRLNAGCGELGISAATSILPPFTFTGDAGSGLGRYAVGQPSLVASGTEVQRWTNVGTTHLKTISHSVSGGGYTVYQGNTVYSAAGANSVTLPVDVASTAIPFMAETSGYIRAEVVGTNSTDTACIHVTLTAGFENFGDTLAFVGSPASTTDQLNAATWSASLSASGDSLSVIATGTVGTIWQVKKLEIGGL